MIREYTVDSLSDHDSSHLKFIQICFESICLCAGWIINPCIFAAHIINAHSGQARAKVEGSIIYVIVWVFISITLMQVLMLGPKLQPM